MKSKVEANYNIERVVQLENAMRDKDRQIEELLNEKKTLEKIKRDHERALDGNKADKEYVSKISSLTEEVSHLREKIRENTKRERMNEKNTKKQ